MLTPAKNIVRGFILAGSFLPGQNGRSGSHRQKWRYEIQVAIVARHRQSWRWSTVPTRIVKKSDAAGFADQVGPELASIVISGVAR
jgi:hypothetical protein